MVDYQFTFTGAEYFKRTRALVYNGYGYIHAVMDEAYGLRDKPSVILKVFNIPWLT